MARANDSRQCWSGPLGPSPGIVVRARAPWAGATSRRTRTLPLRRFRRSSVDAPAWSQCSAQQPRTTSLGACTLSSSERDARELSSRPEQQGMVAAPSASAWRAPRRSVVGAAARAPDQEPVISRSPPRRLATRRFWIEAGYLTGRCAGQGGAAVGSAAVVGRRSLHARVRTRSSSPRDSARVGRVGVAGELERLGVTPVDGAVQEPLRPPSRGRPRSGGGVERRAVGCRDHAFAQWLRAFDEADNDP